MLGQDRHAKRVDSLCDGTLGVLHSVSFAVCAMGEGWTAARGLKPKHAAKQVEWLPFVVGTRTTIMVALDGTGFDAERQLTALPAEPFNDR